MNCEELRDSFELYALGLLEEGAEKEEIAFVVFGRHKFEAVKAAVPRLFIASTSRRRMSAGHNVVEGRGLDRTFSTEARLRPYTLNATCGKSRA